MNEISGTDKQSDVIFEPIKEDTWKFFDAEAFKSLANTRVVSISQLILENIEEHRTGLFTSRQNHPVYKAYNYFRRATEGDPLVKPRADNRQR